ncbi:MAG TPA: CYTH domain-containing protein [Candidatus Nanoarchaeia archaeon]|nr:CYTH domain-containing protein [Candidatus Nanoarchaeia archaeon]
MKIKEIEVEIRGRLDSKSYAELKLFLEKNGTHHASQEREMYLLQDYPGYTPDFVDRPMDIRLRNTNGQCEIMMKCAVQGAREEVSLELKDSNLEKAKKVLKGLGCAKAIWMHRLKVIYKYKDIEWSLVIAPNDIRYYEAELVVANDQEVAQANQRLVQVATELKLEVLDDTGTRALIEKLDKEANKPVQL